MIKPVFPHLPSRRVCTLVDCSVAPAGSSFNSQCMHQVKQLKRPPGDLWCFFTSCRAEAEAGADNEEPDGYGTADPCPGAAEVTGGPSTVRTSVHGEVSS